MKLKYGMMQGRLSPKIGNKIQAFPQNFGTKNLKN